MDSKENIFQKKSMEELLLEQIGNDTQFNSLRFQSQELSHEFPTESTFQTHRPSPDIGHDYSNESAFSSHCSNVFYGEQVSPPEPRNTLPFIFNTREDVVPTMVGVGGGNFMVFGTPTAERNMNVPNLHFANKANGSLGGLGSYPADYQADYNLFSGGMNSVGVQFNSPPEPTSSGTPHLLENLVGQWSSDQSGTYSPFGSSLANVHAQVGDVGRERAPRKTRMVAEVRPMRPSYSDVLAKSVPCQKPGKTSDGKTRHPEVKNGRFGKPCVGRSLSGNGNFNRHNLSVGDEPASSGSNSSLKATGMKIPMDLEQDEPMSKKWVSLDDLTAGLGDGHFISEVKSKKTSPKHSAAKKVKEGWESLNLNAQKAPGTKPLGTKKNGTGVKLPSVQREKDGPLGMKVEPTRNKSYPEERKGTSQVKSADSGKTGRRNSRVVPGDKGKKTSRVKRRDADAGWPGLVAHRADLVAAYAIRAARWFVSLVLDVFALSTNLALYMCNFLWSSSVSSISENYEKVCFWFQDLSITRRLVTSRFWPFRRQDDGGGGPTSDTDSDSDSGEVDGKKKKKRLPDSLKHNLPLPSTGEEAMKRLLACKGKDPYSILGVSQDCTDDDIKKYYKRQAFLVHPDKNNQPGAEEAFKILVHAFDIIGEPEHRKSYDRSVEKTAQAEQAWSELSELLAQLHKKMEYVANTIRCTNCGKRHKRTPVNRPIYAARMCAQCKIHHSAREGEIWAETRVFGLRWRYYACMDGAVYDISEWAACQGNNLKNLKANTHQVQYRIVLGKHAQKNRSQQSPTAINEPDLEEFINNLYSKPETGARADAGQEPAARNRKQKRKK